MIRLEKDNNFIIDNNVLDVWKKYNIELGITTDTIGVIEEKFEAGEKIKIIDRENCTNFNIIKNNKIIGHLLEVNYEDDVVDTEIDFYLYNNCRGKYLSEILAKYLSSVRKGKKIGIVIKEENRLKEYITGIIKELGFIYEWDEAIYIKKIID